MADKKVKRAISPTREGEDEDILNTLCLCAFEPLNLCAFGLCRLVVRYHQDRISICSMCLKWASRVARGN